MGGGAAGGGAAGMGSFAGSHEECRSSQRMIIRECGCFSVVVLLGIQRVWRAPRRRGLCIVCSRDGQDEVFCTGAYVKAICVTPAQMPWLNGRGHFY